MATTGNLEDDPMMGSVFKNFSKRYSQAKEKWGELGYEEVNKVVSVVFKKTISKNALTNLLTKVTIPETCKFAQTYLVNLLFLFMCLLQ